MKFIQATNFTPGRPGGPVRGIVIHIAVTPETATSAEGVANYFANQPKSPNGSSAHYAHDSDSTVQCVKDGDTAWDAPPNTLWPHIGHEHAGVSTQTRPQWLDEFGVKMLRRSAKLTAKQSAREGIPVRRLTVAQIAAKEKGFAGHGDIARAFGMSDHFGCPGDDFPWNWYLTRVRRYRYLYVQYVLMDKTGKVLARSKTVRASSEAAKRFLSGRSGAVAQALKTGVAKIVRRRQF